MQQNTRTVVKYINVIAKSPSDLSNQINKRLENGFHLYGYQYVFNGQIIQPMVEYQDGLEFFAVVGADYEPPSS